MRDDVGFPNRGDREDDFPREEFISDQGTEGRIMVLVIKHDPGIRFLGKQLVLDFIKDDFHNAQSIFQLEMGFSKGDLWIK